MTSTRIHVRTHALPHPPPATGRQIAFVVRLPDDTPSREEIARALFEHFGFRAADGPFLSRHFRTDPRRYFAETLQFNRRSLGQNSAGETTIRLSLSERDYQTLRALSERKREAESGTPPEFQSAGGQRIYDAAPAIRLALESKLPAAEGVGSFLEGAILGGLSENDSWSAIAGQTIVGFVPLLGQIADARDLLAAARDVWRGREGGWSGLGLAAAALVPGLDFLKGGSKAGFKALREVAESGLTHTSQTGLKHLGQVLSRESVGKAGRELIALSVAREEILVRLQALTSHPKLTPGGRASLRNALNALRAHLKQDDLVGALRDRHGLPVIKYGRTWNHLEEVDGALSSLVNLKKDLRRVLQRCEAGTPQYRRISSEIEAVAETTRRIQAFLEIE